ncbi:nucleoside-triphosphatase [Paenibacillus humicola]|uniref:nucleoside-triphosphatase n=1 Tax=Paenibacillus humicola TaxID=3110540 RepID=UPI003B838994
MANVFLLTSKPRMGKSTAVKRIADLVGAGLCGGFYTEEMRADGERTGFKCVALDGREAVIAHIEEKSPLRIGRYGVRTDRGGRS